VAGREEILIDCPPGRAKDREKGLTMLALKLDTDNCQTMEELRSDSGSLLGFCYQAIGCDCIEVVHPKRLPHPYVMIIDESGALKELPLNPLASVLYETDKHGWPIMGTALLMKEAMTDEGPDIVSLNEGDVESLRVVMNRALTKWSV